MEPHQAPHALGEHKFANAKGETMSRSNLIILVVAVIVLVGIGYYFAAGPSAPTDGSVVPATESGATTDTTPSAN